MPTLSSAEPFLAKILFSCVSPTSGLIWECLCAPTPCCREQAPGGPGAQLKCWRNRVQPRVALLSELTPTCTSRLNSCTLQLSDPSVLLVPWGVLSWRRPPCAQPRPGCCLPSLSTFLALRPPDHAAALCWSRRELVVPLPCLQELLSLCCA